MRLVLFLQYKQMRKAITKKQTINKIIRMFLAQYLTTVEDFSAFQNDALNLLTTYIRTCTKLLKEVVHKIIMNVKAITSMQGRTESNVLHLIFCLEDFIPREDLIKYMQMQSKKTDKFAYSYFEKLKQQVFFEDQLEKVNRLQQNTDFANVRSIRKTFTIDPVEECLPFKIPIHDLYALPPEYTFRQNRKIIQHEERQTEGSKISAIRDTRKAISEVMMKKAKQAGQDQQRPPPLMQSHPQKKVKTLKLLKQIQ